jgi:hypothetical protein
MEEATCLLLFLLKSNRVEGCGEISDTPQHEIGDSTSLKYTCVPVWEKL